MALLYGRAVWRLTALRGVFRRGQSTGFTSAGEFWWGGAASTLFWVDPAEEVVRGDCPLPQQKLFSRWRSLGNHQ